ncbi:hypothetical protein ACMFMG_009339 [Clarireedia jacksonii]
MKLLSHSLALASQANAGFTTTNWNPVRGVKFTVAWSGTSDVGLKNLTLFECDSSGNEVAVFGPIATGIDGGSFQWIPAPSIPDGTYIVNLVETPNKVDVNGLSFTGKPFAFGDPSASQSTSITAVVQQQKTLVVTTTTTPELQKTTVLAPTTILLVPTHAPDELTSIISSTSEEISTSLGLGSVVANPSTSSSTTPTILTPSAQNPTPSANTTTFPFINPTSTPHISPSSFPISSASTNPVSPLHPAILAAIAVSIIALLLVSIISTTLLCRRRRRQRQRQNQNQSQSQSQTSAWSTTPIQRPERYCKISEDEEASSPLSFSALQEGKGADFGRDGDVDVREKGKRKWKRGREQNKKDKKNKKEFLTWIALKDKMIGISRRKEDKQREKGQEENEARIFYDGGKRGWVMRVNSRPVELLSDGKRWL